MTSKTPIFVLGLQRSGTTWVANMLAGHPQICAVEADDHRGVHESIYFSHFATEFGELKDQDSRDQFFDYFSTSDYYLLSGKPPHWLSEKLGAGLDSAAIFDALMSDLATDKGASHWLEKSPHHTLMGQDIETLYPHAKFICMSRSSKTLIASRLSAYGRKPPTYPKRFFDIARGCMANILHTREMERFSESRDNAILVRFQDMKSDVVAEVGRIQEFLQVGIDSDILRERYAPNSSFKSETAKKAGLSALDKGLITIFDGLFRLFPMGLLHKIQRGNKDRKGPEWPEWCWKRDGRLPPDRI